MEQFYHILPTKTQVSLQKRGEKNCKSQSRNGYKMTIRKKVTYRHETCICKFTVALITWKMYVQVQFRTNHKTEESWAWDTTPSCREREGQLSEMIVPSKLIILQCKDTHPRKHWQNKLGLMCEIKWGHKDAYGKGVDLGLIWGGEYA